AELRFGARNDAKPGPVAIELSGMVARRGENGRALRSLKSLTPSYLNWDLSEAPEAFWKLAFPLPYRESLERHSKGQSLDPLAVAALIRQESEFDPRAVSRANAVGLTQIVPRTGRELSRKLGLGRYRSSMLTTPDTNLQMGTYYLRTLLDSVDGKW